MTKDTYPFHIRNSLRQRNTHARTVDVRHEYTLQVHVHARLLVCAYALCDATSHGGDVTCT
jgi:hypothetical protein